MEKVGGKVRRLKGQKEEIQGEGLRDRPGEGLRVKKKVLGIERWFDDKEKFGWIRRMFDEQREGLRDWENVLWIERWFCGYGEGRRES